MYNCHAECNNLFPHGNYTFYIIKLTRALKRQQRLAQGVASLALGILCYPPNFR